jgi:hypothetical protein
VYKKIIRKLYTARTSYPQNKCYYPKKLRIKNKVLHIYPQSTALITYYYPFKENKSRGHINAYRNKKRTTE